MPFLRDALILWLPPSWTNSSTLHLRSKLHHLHHLPKAKTMRGDGPPNARARSGTPVFPDQWPDSIEDLVRYMDPRYDGPVLDRPYDMQDPPQTLRFGQRIPSMDELQQLWEPELEAGEEPSRSVENSSSSVEEGEGRRGAARASTASVNTSRPRGLGGGLAQGVSAAPAQTRSQSVGPVPTLTEGLQMRAHTRSQSVGLIPVPTLTEGLEVSRGVKRPLSDSGDARGPMRIIAEPRFESAQRRRTLETSSRFGGLGSAWDVVGGNPHHYETGGFGVAGLAEPGASRSPWLGAITGRPHGNPGLGTGVSRVSGVSGALRTGFQRANPFSEEVEEGGRALAINPRVDERSSRGSSRRSRRRAAATRPESEEESELGLVTALELGRHLTNAGGASQTRPRRIEGGEMGESRETEETGNPGAIGGTGGAGATGGTASVGEETGGTRVEGEAGEGGGEESGPRRRRSGRAWWEAAYAARLQDSKEAKDE
ncbi:hypothetical protein KFL_010910020 [Klebsormidium nitens]|uniref:Uncharacterized protein n=1 Tax=Klebsormidium nitens TaxID=105231 RepID=A0A1Y1IWN0_KLENI|nr:hypothetical protein KFL_010910020 [Klebsormidium nitens]|eukprot:GAQ92678.1 hypothetical protein KFL_010910020 [Klebsormidium nitens]